VGAQPELELVQPRFGRVHLELALANVVEILRGAHDHVDDRPQEREQRGRGGTADQHRVGDAPAGV